MKSGNFVTEKSRQSSAIIQEAFVVVFLFYTAYVLKLTEDCLYSPMKVMSEYVFYSEVSAKLGHKKQIIQL